MSNDKDFFFHMAMSNFPSDVSTSEVIKPEPTELQKAQIWAELLLQEEMFKQDRSIIFLNHK